MISCLTSKICHGLSLTIRNLSVFLMTYEQAGKLLLNLFLIFSPSVPSFCWKFHYVPYKGILYERYCVYFHTYTVRVASRKFWKRFKMEKYHADWKLKQRNLLKGARRKLHFVIWAILHIFNWALHSVTSLISTHYFRAHFPQLVRWCTPSLETVDLVQVEMLRKTRQ